MEKILNKFQRLVVAISFLAIFCSSADAQVVQTYSYTGGMQTFTVPPCVNSMTIEAWGAQGGANWVNNQNYGGYAKGVFIVASGNVLNIFAGGQPTTVTGGYNGGGTGEGLGLGGGGASDVRIGGIAYSNRVIVAGGAGGGGYWSSLEVVGGVGGGLVGGDGFRVVADPGGQGGTQTGSGNGTCGTTNNPSCTGGFGFGGSSISCGCEGYGGGGGWYGGAGSGNCRGGGGGSGYLLPAATGTLFTSGIRVGHGMVKLSYFTNGSGVIASSSNSFICSGGTSTLTASNVLSYTWAPISSNASSISVSPSAATVYTVQGTNSLGCISTATVGININAVPPTLSIATSTTAVCAGKTVTLTASGANTYVWTSGVINGASYSPVVTSDYTVAGTNACGTTSAVTSVTVFPQPNVTASINNPTVCNGSSVILTAGGNAVTYNWSGGVINNSAFVPPASASYTVTGTAANSCTTSAVVGNTVLVTPNIPPTVSPTVICLGQTATLTATGATGYTWTPGTALNSFTAAVSPPMATTYTLVRNNGACSSTMTINLGVNPLPNVSATASPTQICVGDPVTLNVIGGITYTWMPGGFNASNFQLYPNSSTEYTVTASTGSCLASTVVQLSVNPSPVVGINSSTTQVCAGGSVVLTATGNALNYTWLPGPIVGNNITVNPMVPSVYTLTGTNAFNCSVQQTQLIIANELPVLNLLSSVPFVCAGNPAVLSIQNATMSNVTYSWSSNPGTGSLTTVSPSVTTDYFALGTNSVTGCTNTNTLTLSVFISTFAVSGPTAICKGNSATFIASGGATGYAWTNVPGAGNTTSVEVSPASTTNYIVVGTTGNCSSTLTVPLVVNNLPNVTASYVKQQICRLEFGTVTAVGAATYTWNTGETTPSISYNTLTITTIFTVTGTDANGCSKTTTVTQFVATCIGIDALSANNTIGLNVYPNPSNGHFTISSDADIKISIVNALGQVVHTTELLRDNKKDLTVSNLPNGIYFITGESNGVKITKKIIIDK